MASFLITGGAGFIGSHLADALLEAGHRVRVLDDLSTGRMDNVSKEVEFVKGDIRDRQIVKECIGGIDGIFHLAAIASVTRTAKEWLECHTINLTGAINILEAVSRSQYRVPFVYASSAAVYGNCMAPLIGESEELNPISAYGADKLGCELHAKIAKSIHGIPTLGLRFFNIYGPRQDPRSPYAGVISIFSDRARRNLPLEIYGGGDQVRDFVFVKDAAKFLMAAMSHSPKTGNVYNVCTGSGTTVVKIANTIIEIVQTPAKLQFGPARDGDIHRSIGNPKSAFVDLHCRATTEIEAGLRVTVSALGTVGCADR